MNFITDVHVADEPIAHNLATAAPQEVVRAYPLELASLCSIWKYRYFECKRYGASGLMEVVQNRNHFCCCVSEKCHTGHICNMLWILLGWQFLTRYEINRFKMRQIVFKRCYVNPQDTMNDLCRVSFCVQSTRHEIDPQIPFKLTA